jgi:hypothetical protein
VSRSQPDPAASIDGTVSSALPLKVQPVAVDWLNAYEMLCANAARPALHANSSAIGQMKRRRVPVIRGRSAARG